MKVLVCGSRDWLYPSRIHARLDALGAQHGKVTVIHGDSRGADKQAAAAAAALGHEVHAFPANWRPLGRYDARAGFVRNIAMLDEAPGLVLAFQRNGSRGTQHTIDQARKRGIPVEVHTA